MKRLLFVCSLIIGIGLAASADGILLATLDGAVSPATRDYVIRVIERAAQEEARLLILRIDTPGGLESSMRDIVAAELASAVPIVAFVAPQGARAASAGTFITMAADVAAMAPGTNLGAAHPVGLIGSGSEDDASSLKAENDAAAFARSVAEERGRNATWAEEAIRVSSSLSALEAVAAGVVDLVADDVTDLLAKLHGYTLADGCVLETAGVPVETVQPTIRERLLSLLADPNVVYVLFILGLYGLIFEFFSPGIGFGLAAGGVCLLLAFFGLQILPVNVAGVGLILFGATLMVLDAFTPTNGILTAGGVAALVAGSLILFRIPDRSLGLSWETIAAATATTVALSLFVLSKGLLVQRRPPATGRSALVDRTGTVRRPLEPEGTVFIHGEYWTARSIGKRIGAGERVRVIEVEGRTLFVRPDDSTDDSAPRKSKEVHGRNS